MRYDDHANLANQNNATKRIQKVISDIESLTNQIQVASNTLMDSLKKSDFSDKANKFERP